MRIAVTHENGEVFQHFGHSSEFKIYEISDDKIVRADVIGTNGSGHGALSGMLSLIGVKVLICGGIGAGAQIALKNAGIDLYGGVKGCADKAVEDFLAGRLNFDPDAKCDHHDSDHNCSDDDCSSHSCK